MRTGGHVIDHRSRVWFAWQILGEEPIDQFCADKRKGDLTGDPGKEEACQ
jgi:hypothetical protein